MSDDVTSNDEVKESTVSADSVAAAADETSAEPDVAPVVVLGSAAADPAQPVVVVGEEPAAPPVPAPARSARPWILAGVATVLAIAAVVCGGLTYWKHVRDNQLASARTDSVAAARKTVESMFSYDFHTVDAELPKAGDGMTASFKTDYMKLVTGAIAPAAKQKELTVQATAQAAGVISADTDRAVVLLYVNQVTTSKDNPQNTVTPTRVRVNLDHDGGHWLVSGVTPL